MTNEYSEEFDTITNMVGFRIWMDNNLAGFNYNLKYDKSNHSLREWIHMFLSWSEYNENKE